MGMADKFSRYSFLCGWVLLCAISIFVYSHSFTDPYILPKWMFAIVASLIVGICCCILILFGKRICLNMFMLGVGISALGFTEAIWGLLQYLSILSSYSVHTVTGTFDNPAGFASCLCCCLPFVCVWVTHSNRYVRYVGWMMGAFMAVAVCLSGSRSGMVSMVAVCMLWFGGRLVGKGLWRYLLSVILAGLFVIGCYWMKKDSADGRLLIWRCGWEMVKDAPLLGHGIGSFEAKYMDYQAGYFEKHGMRHRYAMLADNVKQPFNEYLGVLLNFGLVGLLVLAGLIADLVYCYKKYPADEKKMAVSALVVIGVFSCFSYPFTYPLTWIVTLLCIVRIAKEPLAELFAAACVRRVVCILVLVGSLVGICVWTTRLRAELNWNRASHLAFMGKYEEALPKYQMLERSLSDNPYFLYNYAAVLTENKQYRKALEVALECRHYWADYDLELLLGDIYKEKKDYKQVEEYYTSASCMCPCRFLPLYQLYELYKNTGNTEKASILAKELLEKPAKVNSALIRKIRYMVKKDNNIL